MSHKSQGPVACVGVVCLRGEEVLMILRGKPPKASEWSIPGGRIEPGESEEQAALRELFEETGVKARLVGKIAEIPARFEGFDYMLHDYAALWESGEPMAGDDALEAQFMSPNDVDALPLWEETLRVIRLARTRVQKHMQSRSKSCNL